MTEDVFRECYGKLEALFAGHGGLRNFLANQEPGYLRLKSEGYMDLSVDRLGPDRIAMAHNFIQNGDLMADPDMEVKVDVAARTAFGMAYQLDGLGVYQAAEDRPGHVNAELRRELTSFLQKWLKNMEEQGFYKIGRGIK